MTESRDGGAPSSPPALPRRRTGAVLLTLAIAAVAGCGVFLLLFPFSGVDPDPPECYSVFGWVVPCDGWVAPTAALLTGAVVAAVVAAALLLFRRR